MIPPSNPPKPQHPEISSVSTHPTHPTTHGFLYRHAALPILALLRMGATPERLAWSIAAGILIGINPVLGTTTVIGLAAAFACRLSVPASQLAVHGVFPLQIAFVIPFLHLGARIFHTADLPMSPRAFLHAARSRPVAVAHQLWMWEWHAFVLWAILALVTVPLLALALTPVLRHVLHRIQRRQYPILEPACPPTPRHP